MKSSFGLGLADVALDAAYDFDMLRLGEAERRGGVARIAQALRAAFPRDGNVTNGQVSPRDVLVINEVLERTGQPSSRLVNDVVRDINRCVDDMVAAWERQEYGQRYVDFLLTLSRLVPARYGRSGHTFLAW